MKSVLIYNSECKFCTDLSFWLRDFIGADKLEIRDNKKTIVICSGFALDKTIIRKDVHFLGSNCELYSKGYAVAKVLALKKELNFISQLADNSSIIRLVFDFIYYIAKKVKIIYNKLKD